LNILLIPATDWLRHPVISRQHHIFERIAQTNNVHVLEFELYRNNKQRQTNLIVHRLPAIPFKGLAPYYLFNLASCTREIVEIIKENQIEALVVTNLLPGIPSCLGKNLGCKIVFDLKDLFSDNSAIYYSNTYVASIIRGTAEWLLQNLLKGSDHVITVSKFLVDYARSIGIQNVSLITNGAELGIFKPNLPSKLSLLENPFINGKVIGFVGTIDRWVDFETVFLALKELQEERKDLKLLIVGGKMVTKYFENIKEQVKRMNLSDSVIFTGVVPHENVPYYISMMDICLIPMKPELRLNQARCPDKLFEYLACGKPVISTRISEVERIGNCTVKFYNDVPSLKSSIIEVLANDSLRTKMAQDALNIAKDYSWEAIAKNYEAVLAQVIDN
jgi:glycosyltransferase involved in cell wall biosynthesis